MGTVFPELKPEDAEYKRIHRGILGKTTASVEDIESCAPTILAGVKALDADNEQKFAGLKTMAEKLELDKHIQEAKAGRGSYTQRYIRLFLYWFRFSVSHNPAISQTLKLKPTETPKKFQEKAFCRTSRSVTSLLRR